MKTNRYLLPPSFKWMGWIISVPCAITLIIYLFLWLPPHDFFENLGNNLTGLKFFDLFYENFKMGTICMILLTLGLLCIAFSREKVEDEYTTKLRGDSLIWAALANFVWLVASFVLQFVEGYIYVVFLNLYSLLVLFIVRYRLVLNRYKKLENNEE